MAYNNIKKIKNWTREDLSPALQKMDPRIQDEYCALLTRKAQALAGNSTPSSAPSATVTPPTFVSRNAALTQASDLLGHVQVPHKRG